MEGWECRGKRHSNNSKHKAVGGEQVLWRGVTFSFLTLPTWTNTVNKDRKKPVRRQGGGAAERCDERWTGTRQAAIVVDIWRDRRKRVRSGGRHFCSFSLLLLHFGFSLSRSRANDGQWRAIQMTAVTRSTLSICSSLQALARPCPKLTTYEVTFFSEHSLVLTSYLRTNKALFEVGPGKPWREWWKYLNCTHLDSVFACFSSYFILLGSPPQPPLFLTKLLPVSRWEALL